ncbi:hypothetical protein C2E23DRAFT_554092 [Lenzites betulinus]|nr:hypothetical protein C2E23DRAFT_554092 [Lenzites betulinus]
MACKVAREAGYELLWIDACCIDKSSSAELAEAINSMFEWYRLSDVCYAFLADVPHSDDPQKVYSRFWDSRWHKRGWTLQELVAPDRVIFLTRTWTFLGTKSGLARTIEEVTGIDFDILIGRAPIDSVSVARRMAWAAERETTRLEDRAYSLLGIFGVHMAPIYGEGPNAFLRLQDEILRTVPDQTIFVWGRHTTSSPGLLASSPSSFEGSTDYRVMSPVDFASKLRLRIEEVPPLHAVATPQGIRIKLLCLDVNKFPDIAGSIPDLQPLPEKASCRNCREKCTHMLLAILRCQDRDGDLVALPLRRSPPDHEKGLYVGYELCPPHSGSWNGPTRMFFLPEVALAQLRAHRPLSAVDVSILHHHFSPPSSRSSRQVSLKKGRLRSWPLDWEGAGAVEFEFSLDSIRKLAASGFHLSPLQCNQSSRTIDVSFTLYSTSSNPLSPVAGYSAKTEGDDRYHI